MDPIHVVQAAFGPALDNNILRGLHHRQALLGFEGILAHTPEMTHTAITGVLEICETSLDLSDALAQSEPYLALDISQGVTRVLKLAGRHIQARETPRFNVVDLRRNDLSIPPVPADAVVVL